jgi:hypothetical protein
MSCFSKKTRDGESGMALLLAIGFLAILSLLGAVVMRVSTEDLKASGTKEPGKQVFYAADRAVEYAMTRSLILNLAANGEENLMTDTVDGTTTTHATVINTSDSVLTAGMVYDVGPNDMLSALAELFGEDFGANYYHVEAKVKTVKVGAGGVPLATSNVNSSIVRLFKRDDDTIFRTSRGG